MIYVHVVAGRNTKSVAGRKINFLSRYVPTIYFVIKKVDHAD